MNPVQNLSSSDPRALSPELASSRPEPRAPNPEPRISIVTPSYNQGKYLEKTILSVLDQGYPNLEYIIIDGGSTDESVEIIKKYQDRLAYWVREPDRGQSHAINKGFERATGEIYGWLNSDDWYHPGALQAVVEAFAANPEAGAVVGAGELLNETGYSLIMESYEISVESLYDWVDKFFMQPSCFFKCETWHKCGPLKENIHFAMDLDLWFRIAHEFRFAKIEFLISSSLVHKDAKTKASAASSIVDAASVIMSHGGEETAKKRLGMYVDELLLTRPLVPQLKQQLEERGRQVEERDRQLAERDRQIAECDRQIAERDRWIDALHNSYSWKITKPLRKIFTLIS